MKSPRVLSRAERDVYQELITGLPTKQIAAKLFVCEKTVKYHLTNIYKKLGVKNRMAAILKSIETKEGL